MRGQQGSSAAKRQHTHCKLLPQWQWGKNNATCSSPQQQLILWTETEIRMKLPGAVTIPAIYLLKTDFFFLLAITVCISTESYLKSEIHSYLTLVWVLPTVLIRKMKSSTFHPSVIPRALAFWISIKAWTFCPDFMLCMCVQCVREQRTFENKPH